MNKSDLARTLGVFVPTKEKSEQIVNAIFNTIAGAIKEGEEVNVYGFGKFKTISRNSKICRNPQTGKAIESPAHMVVKFIPAKSLKDAVR